MVTINGCIVATESFVFKISFMLDAFADWDHGWISIISHDDLMIE